MSAAMPSDISSLLVVEAADADAPFSKSWLSIVALLLLILPATYPSNACKLTRYTPVRGTPAL